MSKIVQYRTKIEARIFGTPCIIIVIIIIIIIIIITIIIIIIIIVTNINIIIIIIPRYEDSLPCLKLTPPEHCPKPVSFNSLDEEEDQEEQDDFFEDEGWKRKKRSIPDLRDADFESWEKPKGGFVNCTCNWGLFRDRNVTLREPVKIFFN